MAQGRQSLDGKAPGDKKEKKKRQKQKQMLRIVIFLWY